MAKTYVFQEQESASENGVAVESLVKINFRNCEIDLQMSKKHYANKNI